MADDWLGAVTATCTEGRLTTNVGSDGGSEVMQRESQGPSISTGSAVPTTTSLVRRRESLGLNTTGRGPFEGLGVPKINGGERDLGLFSAAPQLNLESYLGFYCSQATQSSGGRDAKR